MATPAAVLSIIVEANTGKAEAALKNFGRQMDKADRDKATATLQAEVDKGGFNVFSGLVAKADRQTATAKLKADIDQGSFTRAAAMQAVLTKESSRLGDVFNRSQLSIGQWTAILAASIPVVVDLAGALGALTASAAAATAGLGALAVGGGATGTVGLAGIASIAVPAIAKLKDLKTAQDAYTEAVQRYGKHSTQARTAFTALALAQKQAGPEATKFAETLSKMTRRWREFTQAGQRDFFGLLSDGIDRLNKKLPMLAKSANSSMAALRMGFDRFLDKATGPEFNHFIHVMTRTFANSMGPIADAFGNIAIVLQRIAVAVAPDIVRMVKGFKGMTQGWVDSTRNAGKLRETIHGLVNQANTWWKLIKATAGLFAAVLAPGADKGKRAIEGITATIKEWTNWVNAHPKEMRDFFKEGLETTKRLAEVLLGFLPMLFQVAKAMRPIARFFLGVAKALNSIKIGNISALTVLLGAMVSVKLLGGIRTAIGLFTALKVAALGAAAAETAAGSAGAFAGAKGLTGAAAAGSRFGLAFAGAWAIPVTATIAATFTEGGLLDTIKGHGSATAGAVLGGKIGQAMTARFDAVTKKLPDLSIQNLKGKREQLVSTAKTLGKLEGAGIGDGMVKGLRQQSDELKSEIDARIKALKFGEKFAHAIASAKKPVGAATRGLMDKFQNLNNASRRTFFESVHRYVDSMVRTGQISRRQGDRIESYWARVRRREARQWDRFVEGIKGGFHGILLDLEKLGNQAIAGKGAMRTLKGWAGAAGKAIGGGDKGGKDKKGGQQGGLVTEQGIVPIGFARGGLVGRGGGRPSPKDTVPAMLEPGELVIPKRVVDQTRKNSKLTATAMTEEIGKGYKQVRKESGEFTKDHGKKLEKMRAVASTLTGRFRKSTITDFDVTSKRGSDITDRLRGNVGKDFDRMRADTTRNTERMRGNVTDGMGRMRDSSVKSSQKMEKGVGGNFRDMTGAVGDGLNKIAKMTNSALKALGVKTLDFGTKVQKKQKGGPVKAQRGGHIDMPGVPATGDHIPALLEKGEFVVNSKAAAKHRRALETINFSDAPRFQKGGLAFALGPETVPPIKYDAAHAGSNSHLHVSGTSSAWVVGIGRKLQQMGWDVGEHPAFGGVSPVHAHYGPTDHYHGGAIDANTAADESHGELVAAARLLKSGVVGAIAKKIKDVVLTGPDGSLKDMGNAVLAKVTAAASDLIERKSAAQGEAAIPDVGGPVVAQMGKILLANNFSRAGAAGIIGNAYRESLWDPGAVGTGGGGLFGFTTSPVSLADMQAFAKRKGRSWTDVGTQMEFMLTGSGSGGLMSGSYYNGLEAFLKSTKNVHDATYRFMDEWERPGIPAFGDRLAGAKRAYASNTWQEGGLVGKALQGAIGMQKGGDAKEKKSLADMSIRRLLGISRRGKGDDDQKALDELLGRIHEEEKGAPVKPQGQLHDWMEKLELLELKHRFHPKAKVNQRRLNVFVRAHAKKMIHQLHRRGETYKNLRQRKQIAEHTPGTKDDERIQNRIDEFLGEGGGMLGKIHEAQKGVPIKPFGHLFKYLEELKVLELKRSLHPGSKKDKRNLKEFLKEDGRYILGALKFRKKEWHDLQIKKQIAAHTPDKKDDERIARLIEKFLGKKPGTGADGGDQFARTEQFFEFLRLLGPTSMPTFAKGGKLAAGKMGIAGERGPELIQGPATVTSTAQTASILQPNFDIHVYVGDREITDIVDVRINKRSRDDTRKAKAGVSPSR